MVQCSFIFLFAVYVSSQQIPTLPQQFKTTYNGKINANGITVDLTGMAFYDAIEQGAYVNESFDMDGQYYTQNYVSPSNGQVTLYSVVKPPVGSTTCYKGHSFPFSQIPPFALPPTALFQGKEIVNGIPTQVWAFNFFVGPTYTAAIVVYLSLTDTSIVRVNETVTMIGQTNTALIDFSNTALGPVNTQYFVPPSICQTELSNSRRHHLNQRRIPQEMSFFSVISRLILNHAQI